MSIGQDLLAFEVMEGTELHGFSGRRLWGPSLGNDPDLDKHSHTLWDINEILKDKDSLEGDDKLKEESKMSPKVKDKKGKEGKVSPPVVHSLKTTTTNAASIITNTIKPIGKFGSFEVSFLALQKRKCNN